MRRSLAFVLALAVSAASATGARADTVASAIQALTGEGTDAKARVVAAKSLGKSRAPAARGALERSLGDPEKVVRAAIVAALEGFADPASLPPLRAALDRESDATMRTALEKAVKKVEARRPKTKFLVAIGPAHDRSGSGSESIVEQKLRARLVDVPGVEVADGADEDIAAAAKKRGLAALAVDATLSRLSPTDGKAGFSARVELSVRKLPDQVLKAFLSGSGDAMGGTTVNDSILASLRGDAIGAAVESATSGVQKALEAGAKR